MDEVIVREQDGGLLTEGDMVDLRGVMRQMADTMGAMAAMISTTNERMSAMERKISALEKVTPSQAQELNRLMGQRARELAELYRIEGTEKVLASAIRKAVRLETGVKSTREISRCDFPTVRSMICDWDDFDQIRAIKRALRG